MNERENIRRKKLSEYFKSNLQKGYTLDALKWALLRQGNSRVDVDYAVEQVKDEMSKINSMKSANPQPQAETEIVTDESVMSEKKSWWKFW